MRVLKIGAIISLSLLIVMVVIAGYLFMTAEVLISSVECDVMNAAADEALFSTLKRSVNEETFQGTLYNNPQQWEDANEYAFVRYTLHLQNNCLVPIDMIEVQVLPHSDDILQIADLEMHSLPLKSEGALTAQILCSENTQTARELIVTYYVWGVGFSIRIACGM